MSLRIMLEYQFRQKAFYSCLTSGPTFAVLEGASSATFLHVKFHPYFHAVHLSERQEPKGKATCLLSSVQVPLPGDIHEFRGDH